MSFGGTWLFGEGAIIQLSEISHPTFDLKQTSINYFEEILQYHKNEIISFQKNNPQQITIIAHSIGGFFALKLLEAFSPLVKDCLLLQPFLKNPAPLGFAILKLIHTVHKTKVSEKILFSLRPLLEKMISNLHRATTEEIKSALNLAYYEYILALNQMTIEIKQELRKKNTFIL